jgi:hypothetical protein
VAQMMLCTTKSEHPRMRQANNEATAVKNFSLGTIPSAGHGPALTASAPLRWAGAPVRQGPGAVTGAA